MMKTRVSEMTVRDLLALITVVGSFGMLYVLMFVHIPETNKDMFNFVSGTVLGATLVTVFRSYFPTKGEDKLPPNTEQTTVTNTTTPPAKPE